MAQEQLPFLNRIARRRPAAERCELCSVELAPMHQHLLDPVTRQISCSCDGCAVLFCGQAGAHYLRVPRRIRALADFQMPDLQWESLMIPINLAFFYRDSAADRVRAMYPSPAGAIESLLPLESWAEIAAAHPSQEQAIWRVTGSSRCWCMGASSTLQSSQRSAAGRRRAIRFKKGSCSCAMPIHFSYEIVCAACRTRG